MVEADLYLFKGDFEAETLVEVRIERVFLDRRLLLLDAFSVLLEDDLHEGILKRKNGARRQQSIHPLRKYGTRYPISRRRPFSSNSLPP